MNCGRDNASIIKNKLENVSLWICGRDNASIIKNKLENVSLWTVAETMPVRTHYQFMNCGRDNACKN